MIDQIKEHLEFWLVTTHLAYNETIRDFLRYASHQVLQAADSGRDSGSRG